MKQNTSAQEVASMRRRIEELEAQNAKFQQEAASMRRRIEELEAQNAEFQQAAAGASASGGGATWRNIRYGQPTDRRLPSFQAPDRSKQDTAETIPFGEILQAAEDKTVGKDVWLRLQGSRFAGKWVLARDGSTVNCVQMSQMKHLPGRIPDEAFRGQDFPTTGMYTEGYAGAENICLVSASGDACWREINVEMLFRDIATATVFEKQWGGDTNFMDWVAYYAANIVLYGRLGTPMPKRLLVTVKHTARWRGYLMGCCLGPDVDRIKDDIGNAQYKECSWIKASAQRLRIKWEEVEFLTAFAFLKEHCTWTAKDCAQAALVKLRSLSSEWGGLEKRAKRAYQLSSAFWCLDEALSDPVQVLEETDCRLLVNMFDDFPAPEEVAPLKEGAEKAAWLPASTWSRVVARAKARPQLEEAEREVWPALYAASRGWCQALELLLERGADKEAKDGVGKTPAHWAARNGHLEVLKLLLDSGADKEAKDQDGKTPAHWAALNGHLGALELLLDRGADKEATGIFGETPAHIAAITGHLEALRLLLDRGADKEAKDQDGQTPAYLAASKGHLEALRLLLDRGADKEAKDQDGRTPAYLAASKGHLEALRLLLDHGADAGAKAGAKAAGYTPAHVAAQNGHLEALRLLLDRGADAGAKAEQGSTPAHKATIHGHLEVLKLLLDRGADAGAKAEQGVTPAHDAAMFGHLEVLKLLLDRGADKEAKWRKEQGFPGYDVFRGTDFRPAHLAAMFGQLEVVRLLLARGADMGAKTTDGMTPAIWAHITHATAVVDFLRSRGYRVGWYATAGTFVVEELHRLFLRG